MLKNFEDTLQVTQSPPNPTVLVYRVTIKHFSNTPCILNLIVSTLTARRFTSGERSRIA